MNASLPEQIRKHSVESTTSQQARQGRVAGFWRGMHRWALGWLLVMLFFFGYDLIHDAVSDGFDLHVLMEAVTFCAVTAVLIVAWRQNRGLTDSLQEVSGQRERLSGQFSDHVRHTFHVWAFTNSEREVAWLLLKGFSFAEIAGLRGVQEKTVRQQATGIYAKSGCKNRNEFLACFIQDLLEADYASGAAASAAPQSAPVPVKVAAPAEPATNASVRAPE